MALVFEELIADRGVLAATARTAIDLIVTVPRYRLEAVMTESNTTRALTLAIPGLLGLGAVSALVGGQPLVSAVMVLVAAGLFIANQGRLSRSIRTPASPPRTADASARTHRLRLAAFSAGVCGACLIGFMIVTWDGEVSSIALLLPTTVGPIALVAALWFLVTGLLTPRAAHAS